MDPTHILDVSRTYRILIWTSSSFFLRGVSGSKSLNIFHPDIGYSDEILTDALERISAIMNAPDKSREERLMEFAAAMFGYYNAMPYRNGSASIGRVFFAGMYLAIFGKRIPSLPDGTDVYAMVLTQEGFIKTFLRYIK